MAGQAGHKTGHKIRQNGITILGRSYRDTCTIGRMTPDWRPSDRQDGMYPKGLHFIH